MEVSNIITYHTHVVDIEDGANTYSVTVTENDFGYDFQVLDVENYEEISEDNPIYALLVELAEEAILHRDA